VSTFDPDPDPGPGPPTAEPVNAESASLRSVPPQLAGEVSSSWDFFSRCSRWRTSTPPTSIISRQTDDADIRYLLMTDDAKTAWLTLGVCFLAAFWKKSVPILRVVDFIGSHVAALAIASVARWVSARCSSITMMPLHG